MTRPMGRLATLLVSASLFGLSLTGCSLLAETSAEAKPKRATEQTYKPALQTSYKPHTSTVADKLGADVTLIISVETPKLTGVDSKVSRTFSAAFEDEAQGFIDLVTDSVADFEAQWLSCESASECEIPVDISLPVAEIYEDAVTVTLHQRSRVGGTSLLVKPAAITLDLKTGEPVSIDHYASVTAPATQQAVTEAGLKAMQTSSNCEAPQAKFALESGSVWSPTSEGLVVTFDAKSANLARSCGVVHATVPWESITTPSDAQGETKSESETKPQPGATPQEQPAQKQDAGTSAASAFPTDCLAIVPAEALGANMKFGGASYDTSQLTAGFGYGPVALDAFTQASNVLDCSYHVPNSGSFSNFVVIEMPASARDALLTGLRDSVYTESSFTPASGPAVPLFVWDPQEQYGPGVVLRYAFVDDLVVTSFFGGEVAVTAATNGLRELS